MKAKLGLPLLFGGWENEGKKFGIFEKKNKKIEGEGAECGKI